MNEFKEYAKSIHHRQNHGQTDPHHQRLQSTMNCLNFSLWSNLQAWINLSTPKYNSLCTVSAYSTRSGVASVSITWPGLWNIAVLFRIAGARQGSEYVWMSNAPRSDHHHNQEVVDSVSPWPCREDPLGPIVSVSYAHTQTHADAHGRAYSNRTIYHTASRWRSWIGNELRPLGLRREMNLVVRWPKDKSVESG